MSLDFFSKASACPAMAAKPEDPGLKFARLTALLEDAAALAAEGQSDRLTADQRAGFARRIRSLLNSAEVLATGIDPGSDD